MKEVTIITAAYGVDTLQEQPAQDTPGWRQRWVAVSDREQDLPTPWEQLYVQPRPHVSDRMASKVPKYLPSLFTHDEWVIWLDASVRLQHDQFLLWVLAHIFEDDDPCIALIPHPDRSSIAAEAPEAAAQGRYHGQMVGTQVAEYLADFEDHDVPDDALWCSTVVGWHRCQAMQEFGRQWMLHNVVWTAQDQLSLAYLLKVHGLHVASLEIDLWDNTCFTLRQRTEDK